MDGWTDETGGRMDGWTDKFMNRGADDGWTNGQTDVWTDGWMDRQIHELRGR